MAEPVAIYYINLAKRADRRTFFESQCARLGLSPTRIEAVTPGDLSAADLETFCNMSGGMKPVELACIRSHLVAWRQFLASDAAYGAFFEDDALLSDSLPAFFTDYAENAAFGYGLIRLDHARRVRLFPSRARTANGIALHEFRSTVRGTAGYLLTRKAAEELLVFPGWGAAQFDLALYNPFKAPGNLVPRALINPALCVQFASSGEVRQNSGIGLSDIDPPKPEQDEAIAGQVRQNAAFGKKIGKVLAGLHNGIDHLLYLHKGLRKTRVFFKGDTPFM